MADWGKAGWGSAQPTVTTEENSVVYDGSALGWGDAISFSGINYIVLAPGIYDFTVKSFERGYYNGSSDGKNLPCPTVKVVFGVNTPEGEANINQTFYLRKWESAIDFIYNFFVSIGFVTPQQRENKVPFVPKWEETVGRQGRFEIKNQPKKDDPKVIYNNIKKFLDPQ